MVLAMAMGQVHLIDRLRRHRGRTVWIVWMQLPLARRRRLASSISNVAAAVNCDGRMDGRLLLGRAIDGAAPVMLRAKPPVQR